MDFRFKETNKTFYKIFEDNKERYLLDMTTLSPKTYFWGRRSEILTAKMVPLDKRDKSLEGLVLTANKSLGPAIGVGVGCSLYRLSSRLFATLGISHNIFLKLVFYLFSILLAYGVALLIIWIGRLMLFRKIPDSQQKYRVSFRRLDLKRKLNAAKLFGIYSFINLIIIGFYYSLADGTEGAFLVISFMLSLGFFLVNTGMLPLREAFDNQEIVLEKIEKI